MRLESYGDDSLFERCVLDSLWDRRERMRNDGSRVKYAYHGEMDGLWARYLICHTLKSFRIGWLDDVYIFRCDSWVCISIAAVSIC